MPGPCEQWLEAVSAHVDGELDGPQRAALERHLTSCQRCRNAAAILEEWRRRMRVRPAPRVPDRTEAILARAEQEGIATPLKGRRHRRRWVLAGAAAALVGVAGLGAGLWAGGGGHAAKAGGSQTVQVMDRQFHAASATVRRGGTVRWTNIGGTTHHLVIATPGAVVSGSLGPEQTEAVTFAQAGTYTFYCTIHPGMTGKVTVTS